MDAQHMGGCIHETPDLLHLRYCQWLVWAGPEGHEHIWATGFQHRRNAAGRAFLEERSLVSSFLGRC